MSIDLRTRSDALIPAVKPENFFGSELPELMRTRGAHIAGWLAARNPPEFTIECGGIAWALRFQGQVLVARRGVAEQGLHVRLSVKDFSDLVSDQVTPITFLAAGELDLVRGDMGDYRDFWLVLRALMDDRPIHVSEPLAFEDGEGSSIDLGQSFGMETPLETLRAFLETAGFLHLRSVFSADEMDSISAEMDAAMESYSEGDRRSWWATTADGTRRLVRMQAFDERSPTTARLLGDARLARIGAIPDGDYEATGLENNRIEALVKPLHVVEGVSDLAWHKDCAQGRHSYDCCSMTLGISVTGAGPRTGQIRVIAGSHRVLMWPSTLRDAEAFGLPVIDLPTETGDVTVHLSCTHHMAQAPVDAERRVLYTSFRPAGTADEKNNASRARIRAARESAHQRLSDRR